MAPPRRWAPVTSENRIVQKLDDFRSAFSFGKDRARRSEMSAVHISSEHFSYIRKNAIYLGFPPTSPVTDR
jgi:hypothetical protein